METIEIGLVVIDLESLEIVDEFQRFVRPQINPTLTAFCKKLTSIHKRTWTVVTPIRAIALAKQILDEAVALGMTTWVCPCCGARGSIHTSTLPS